MTTAVVGGSLKSGVQSVSNIQRLVEELAEWQARPLDRVYPVVFIDALMVKIRDGVVANRPVYLAIGIESARRPASPRSSG